MNDIGRLEINRNDQLVVWPTLQTSRDDHVFAMGDCCAYTPAGAERPVPPRAQAAHQMAATVFKNIRRSIQGKQLTEFVYRDHGSLVSLSRFSTVGSLMGALVGGRLARFVYVSLYRMHLLAIHGVFAGAAFILLSKINQVVRPKLKLH